MLSSLKTERVNIQFWQMLLRVSVEMGYNVVPALYL